MKPIMTLEEYLQQEEPQRMPNVVLQKSEYKLGMKISNYQHVQIWDTINDKPYPTVSAIEYAIKDGGKVLYTCDKDGNPQNRSCFSLE